MLVCTICTICQGTGWKITCKQGDLVPDEKAEELRKLGMIVTPCYYAATTYEMCDCRMIKVSSTILTIPIQGTVIMCGATNDHIVRC